MLNNATHQSVKKKWLIFKVWEYDPNIKEGCFSNKICLIIQMMNNKKFDFIFQTLIQKININIEDFRFKLHRISRNK
jgi:hypothetical protein